MQQFLLNDGKDTREKWWGRALLRMHKELMGMAKDSLPSFVFDRDFSRLRQEQYEQI